MGEVMNFFAQYWPVLLLVAFGLIVLYWLLSKFFKFTMALLVILLALAGYHYYNSTGTFTERLMQAFEKLRTQYDPTLTDGKTFFDGQKEKLDRHFNEAADQTQKDAKERDRTMTRQGEAIEDKLKLR